jgi:hypothetical protein
MCLLRRRPPYINNNYTFLSLAQQQMLLFASSPTGKEDYIFFSHFSTKVSG